MIIRIQVAAFSESVETYNLLKKVMLGSSGKLYGVLTSTQANNLAPLLPFLDKIKVNIAVFQLFREELYSLYK